MNSKNNYSPERALDSEVSKKSRGKPKREFFSWKHEIFVWGSAFLISFSLMFVIKLFVFDFITVSGLSMYPTLVDNQRVLILKGDLGKQFLNRGDIVVLNVSKDNDFYGGEQRTFNVIKRVVAFGGDTISCSNGKFYVNGNLLTEQYVVDPNWDCQISNMKIPENSIWVMGDNRVDSKDSRYYFSADQRFFSKNEILGKVIWS